MSSAFQPIALTESSDLDESHHCCATSEDSKHVIFRYSRFADERGKLNDYFNVFIGPQILLEEMLILKANRSAVNATIIAI